MPLLLAQIDWNALLQKPDTFPMLLGFGTTAIVILGVTIAIQWRKVQQAKNDAILKQQMIERGFPADEIVSVINAGAGHDKLRTRAERADRAANRACCAEPLAS